MNEVTHYETIDQVIHNETIDYVVHYETIDVMNLRTVGVNERNNM